MCFAVGEGAFSRVSLPVVVSSFVTHSSLRSASVAREQIRARSRTLLGPPHARTRLKPKMAAFNVCRANQCRDMKPV